MPPQQVSSCRAASAHRRCGYLSRISWTVVSGSMNGMSVMERVCRKTPGPACAFPSRNRSRRLRLRGFCVRTRFRPRGRVVEGEDPDEAILAIDDRKTPHLPRSHRVEGFRELLLGMHGERVRAHRLPDADVARKPTLPRGGHANVAIGVHTDRMAFRIQN